MGEDADQHGAGGRTDDPTGLDGLLAPGARLEQVSEGCTWNEGPVWVRPPGLDHGVLRWSDIPGDRIMQLDPATGTTTVHRDGVEFTNGRTPAPDGGVYQCSHGLRRVEHEVDGPDGPVVTPVVDRWNGARLNSPNDVVCAADGSVWFSDPPYGIVMKGEGHAGRREYAGSFVFRWDPAAPAASALRVMVTDCVAPNGLAFSPDEDVLYVSDTCQTLPWGGRGHHIRAYDLGTWPDGGLTARHGRTVAVIERGVPDGFRVDVAGRIWTSSLDAVIVLEPDGTEVGRVPVPEVIANVTFGGEDGHDLYVCASTSVYRIVTTTTGATTARDAAASDRAAATAGTP